MLKCLNILKHLYIAVVLLLLLLLKHNKIIIFFYFILFSNHNNLINCTPPPPAPPYLQLSDNKSTPQNYSSPKFRVRSPSPFRSTGATINSNMNNKENKSPYLPSYQTVTSTSSILNKNSSNNNLPCGKQQQFATPSNTEIVNVAQRFLSKRNSNSQPSESTVSASNTDNLTHSESLVKSMKSRFENSKLGKNENNDVQDSSHMTPKLIIKKFEQMLKDGTQVQPLTGTVITSSAPACSSNTNTIKKVCSETNNILKTNITNQTPIVAQNESIINTDHIKPKSIIEKFESLVKSQQVDTIINKL